MPTAQPEPACEREQVAWRSLIEDLMVGAPVFVAAAATTLLADLLHPGLPSRVKLFALCEMVEVLTRFLVGMRVAEIAGAAEGQLPPALATALHGELQMPTFGRWRSMLERLASYDMPSAMPQFGATSEAVLRLLGRRDRVAAEDEAGLISIRNALAHGSAGVSEAMAAALLQNWGPACGEAFASATWLRELHVYARYGDAVYALNGPNPMLAEAPPADLASLEPGAVVLCRGALRLSLSPFGRLGSALEDGPAFPQSFVRRGPVALTYAAIQSDHALQVSGDAAGLELFDNLFTLRLALRQSERTAQPMEDFGAAFSRDAAGIVGRAGQSDRLWELASLPSGVIWVGGQAGIGKSSLIARLYAQMRAELDDCSDQAAGQQVLLPYRFRAGYANCSGAAFLRWIVQRTSLAIGEVEIVEAGPHLSQLRQAAAALLGRHSLQRLVFLIDGIDEVTRYEPSFWRDVLPALTQAAPGTLFILSGREESGLPELMRDLGATIAFPGGVPGMTEMDLRIFLDSRLQRVARKLVRQDGGEGTAGNPFVAEVVRRSEGLPIYAELLVRDIASGRFSLLDAVEAGRLPVSVAAYFGDLVQNARLDDEQSYGGLVALLIVHAREPMEVAVIADLLGRDDFDAGPEQQDKVRAILTNLGGAVRQRFRPDGSVGYEIYHTSLADFLRQSRQVAWSHNKARRILERGARAPEDGPAAAYLYRHGVSHLIEAKKDAEAASLIAGFGYQVARLTCLGDAYGGDGGMRADWRAVSDAHVLRSGALGEPALSWHLFWATDGALFRFGEGRHAGLELLERCLEYAPDTVMGASVDKYLAAHGED